MVKGFSVELTADEVAALRQYIGGAAIHPDTRPGRKTFAFNETSLIAISNGDFECFLWSAFDRVEQRGGTITLAKGDSLVFFLPVSKLQDPEMRRAIWDFVTGRVSLNA